MHDLALEVGVVDDVGVDDAEGADPGRCEVERRRRAEPAGADQEHAGVEQLLLPLFADLGNQDVARVAGALLGAERARRLELEAVPLPVGEPAGHRGDVVVAELGERLRGERRAGTGGAVDDDLARPVGDDGLDARLEIAARDVHRAGEVTLLPLVLLAHVEEQRPVELAEASENLRRGDLVDLVLDLGQ